MQNKNALAENLLNLFNLSSYKEFGKGFFVNKPEMSGYYYIFKNLAKPKFCLILNTNKDFVYPSNSAKVNDYVFIVFNIISLENFLETFTDKNFAIMLNVLDAEMEKRSDRNLPYGYYLDENGDLKVDMRRASEVRNIYNLYLELKNVREVASTLRKDFSFIRDILHDAEEYLQMRDKIVSISKLKEVSDLMAENVRGGAQAKRDIESEIKAARQKRKQLKAARVN